MKKYVLLVFTLLSMGAIFWFSSQPGDASSKTSDFIKYILSFIPPLQALFEIIPIRKVAHFTAYLILGIFSFNFIRCFKLKTAYVCIITIAMCFLYACSDEFHQTFVVARDGNFIDVLIDTSGATTGMLLSMLAGIKQKSKA